MISRNNRIKPGIYQVTLNNTNQYMIERVSNKHWKISKCLGNDHQKTLTYDYTMREGKQWIIDNHCEASELNVDENILFLDKDKKSISNLISIELKKFQARKFSKSISKRQTVFNHSKIEGYRLHVGRKQYRKNNY